MGSKEIVTFQIGHYANFIGTHWWNLQESSFVYNPTQAKFPKEIDHDVMFREGQNLQGEVTYTPRMVAFDLKDSLNTLRQEGTLYEVQGEEEDLKWSSDVTMHKMGSVPKNEFLQDLEADEATMMGSEVSEADKEECDTEQKKNPEDDQDESSKYRRKVYKLEKSVNVWSDFLKVHLHPRSVHIVQQYRHQSDNEPFDVFHYGQEVYKDQASHDEIEDRVHFFVEECDQMQGLQLLVDTYDGFGGIAASLLDDLADDYSNKGIFSIPVAPPVYPNSLIKHDCHRLVNSVLAYDKLLQNSTALLPLSVSSKLWRVPGPATAYTHLDYNASLPYHTSAILAASLDSLSLPYRLEAATSNITHMLNSMTPAGRKMLCLQSSLPFVMKPQNGVMETLLELGDQTSWQSLTPYCTNSTTPLAQSVVLRGCPLDRLKRGSGVNLPKVLDQCTTVQDVLQLYLTEVTGCSRNAICSTQSCLKLEAPYPHIFKPHISQSGELAERETSLATTGVEEVPMMTSLQSTDGVLPHISNMLTEVKRLNIKKFHRFSEAGLEEDDYRETLYNLESIENIYRENEGVS